jgi:serine/threonine protein kinase
MHLNPFIAVLGLSGGELILILLSFIVMLALPITLVAVLIFFWKRGRTSATPAPPVVPPLTNRYCPQCRSELATDAPQGLCPQCLARAAFETQAGGAQPQPWTSAMPISQIAQFFPQLEIIELLGHGGMGVVYKARQPHLDRFVALKILSPDLSRDPAFAERFNREARALARLNHPNIVAVYESGKAGDFYYLVMEYVDGLNLSQMTAAKKRLAPEEAFAIVPKICDALQYAHDEDVVHRDIKPANILIEKKGRVKIADFGLAKMADRDVTGLGLTQSRATMGTPQYMAPEQLEKPLEVDHRADIYSLGVVFYEMLTGELPLGRFPLPSKKVQVDVRLDDIVLRTLEKEPQLRYQKAAEFKTAVETVVSSPGTQKASQNS